MCVCVCRMKIMQNIAISFVKLGQFNDAVTSFEHIMTEDASFRTGLNLILCYFALRDRDNMKRTFERLLTVNLRLDDEHKYSANTQVNLFTGYTPPFSGRIVTFLFIAPYKYPATTTTTSFTNSHPSVFLFLSFSDLILLVGQEEVYPILPQQFPTVYFSCPA